MQDVGEVMKMVRVVIYNRVSGDEQEKHGSSLDTQAEACINYCDEQGYHVVAHFKGSETGLKLDRPMLNELRDHVRAGDIDAVVVYALDRFTRDPNHGVILTEEMERHGIRLEGVAEDIGNSELGKLISYIKGFAAKLEAEKIKERTQRGKKAWAKQGRMASGGFHNTFGYDYHVKADKVPAHRETNNTEAPWVERVFRWYAVDGLSLKAICKRLKDAGVAGKLGKPISERTVHYMLSNPAYRGVTVQYRSTEPIESEMGTPRIVSDELYGAVQQRLTLNSQAALRNKKRDYLLSGHLVCNRCGKPYWGVDGKYRCSGKYKQAVSPLRCDNRQYAKSVLEPIVWREVEKVIAEPTIILEELEKQDKSADQTTIQHYENAIKGVMRELRGVDREQRSLLQWALAGFPEEQVIAENKKFNGRREALKHRKTELEEQLSNCTQAVVNAENLEEFLSMFRERMPILDFKAKRIALEMLEIKVSVDGPDVLVTGCVPINTGSIAFSRS